MIEKRGHCTKNMEGILWFPEDKCGCFMLKSLVGFLIGCFLSSHGSDGSIESLIGNVLEKARSANR